jgi:hypothetical protein
MNDYDVDKTKYVVVTDYCDVVWLIMTSFDLLWRFWLIMTSFDLLWRHLTDYDVIWLIVLLIMMSFKNG